MIQIIGLIISVYAVARLTNEISNRYPQSTSGTVFVWIVSAFGIAAVTVLALLLMSQDTTAVN